MDEDGSGQAERNHAEPGDAHAQEIVRPGPPVAGKEAPAYGPEAEQGCCYC